MIGIAALILLMGAVFWLTFSIGSPIQRWLGELMGGFGNILRGWTAGAPRWIGELLAGGVLGGLGMVLTFLPILAIFYFALGFLEDTGYMARAAYLTDRFMHMMGLHGKSFMPIVLGFGCNVPAVLGTSIIESRKARIQTSLLVPFVPCTARLAVVSILAPIFFGRSAFWVTWALVGGNLARTRPPGAPAPSMRLRRRARGLHHGAAPLSRAEPEDHRHLRMAEPRRLPEEGRIDHPRRLPRRMGLFLLPDGDRSRRATSAPSGDGSSP